MFQFFANIFGYLLELLYNLVSNYGIAIILFTVIIKVVLLPLSIKQQRTTKKSAELQEKMKAIQFKYKNDPEKMNQEIINLSNTILSIIISILFINQYRAKPKGATKAIEIDIIGIIQDIILFVCITVSISLFSSFTSSPVSLSITVFLFCLLIFSCCFVVILIDTNDEIIYSIGIIYTV